MTPHYFDGGVINNWKRQENVGNASYYGGHLLLEYRKDFGAVGVKLWANYSYIDGHIDEGDGVKKELMYIAKNKVKAGATFSSGKYYVTPMVRWIGETNSMHIDRKLNKEQKIRVYTLVNLNMGVNELITNMSASINIRNLMDVRYYNSGASGLSLTKAPQEPRRIVLSMNYKF